MSDSLDGHIPAVGAGGLLYQDAREQVQQVRDRMRVENPALDAPEPPMRPVSSITPAAKHGIDTTAVPKNLPPEPEEPGFDYRELFSTIVELLGVTCVSVGGWLIAPYVGLIIAGIALIVLGVATSRLVGR